MEIYEVIRHGWHFSAPRLAGPGSVGLFLFDRTVRRLARFRSVGFAEHRLRALLKLVNLVSWTGSTSLRGTKFKLTTTAKWSEGNFLPGGVVDGEDFQQWNENEFPSSPIAAVPEPGTALLLLACVAVCNAIKKN